MLQSRGNHGIRHKRNDMEVCIAYMHGEPVMLALRDGVAYINDEAQPIKGLTEEELQNFSREISSIPYAADPGYQALLNARRAAFLAGIMGRAVGDECVSRLTHILDSVHFDVLEFLHDEETDH